MDALIDLQSQSNETLLNGFTTLDCKYVPELFNL